MSVADKVAHHLRFRLWAKRCNPERMVYPPSELSAEKQHEVWHWLRRELYSLRVNLRKVASSDNYQDMLRIYMRMVDVQVQMESLTEVDSIETEAIEASVSRYLRWGSRRPEGPVLPPVKRYSRIDVADCDNVGCNTCASCLHEYAEICVEVMYEYIEEHVCRGEYYAALPYYRAYTAAVDNTVYTSAILRIHYGKQQKACIDWQSTCSA